MSQERQGISVPDFYERIKLLNKEWHLTYEMLDESDHYPAPAHELNSSLFGQAPTDYKQILSFEDAFLNSDSIFCAHAFNLSSTQRVLSSRFRSVNLNGEHIFFDETFTNQKAALLSPFALSARALISSSLIDLTKPETLKTTAPFGVLFRVPWQNILTIGVRDQSVPIEQQGINQSQFIESLNQLDLKINLSNTVDEILSASTPWNEVAFYPRTINPTFEPRIAGFFIDSSKKSLGHPLAHLEDRDVEDLDDCIKTIKDLAVKLELPLFDLADYNNADRT